MAASGKPAGGSNGIEEQETFLADAKARKPTNETKLQSFCKFLYNSETGQLLGRTGLSWLEITIFYVIFYSCLVLFWAVLMFAFLQTLSSDHPRYYGKGSIIGVNPGVGYQPWLSDEPTSTKVHFSPKEPKTYAKYLEQMKSFMKKYADKNNTRPCTGTQSNADEDSKEACSFDVNRGFGECTESNEFGLSKGEPCIIITLNRLIGWTPVAYPKDSVPEVLKESGRYEPGNVGIDCQGEYFTDREHIGEPKYYPKGGMPGKLFPFKVVKNYHQPIAMVQLKNIKRNVLVMVQCKAYAYNIVHDVEQSLGLTHFEVLVEDNMPAKT